MSGEKTEKATPKRRREAREKGQVVKSVEINSAVILLFLYLGMKIFGTMIIGDMVVLITEFFSEQYLHQTDNFVESLQNVYILSLKHFFIICGPLFAVSFLTALFVNYIQVGFLFSPKVLAMKFDKINPVAGFKRIFSLKSLVELVKSIVKMIIVGTVVYFQFKKSFSEIPNMVSIDLMKSATIIWNALMSIMWKTGLTFLIFGIFDYAYQWWQHEKDMKMSKDDIKQEYKLMEGDPKIKAKIRDMQRRMGMRRMMQQIPTADVVITNPTHFAVALKYDESMNKAPVVVAKGQDIVALKIKQEAKKNKVHIVENKPLAQALFKTTNIDEAIPEDLFQAVAEILAIVYQMKSR